MLKEDLEIDEMIREKCWWMSKFELHESSKYEYETTRIVFIIKHLFKMSKICYNCKLGQIF